MIYVINEEYILNVEMKYEIKIFHFYKTIYEKIPKLMNCKIQIKEYVCYERQHESDIDQNQTKIR